MMKCKHPSWKELERRHTPPRQGDLELESVRGKEGAMLLKELMYGITTIEQQCTRCNYINFTTVVGDQT